MVRNGNGKARRAPRGFASVSSSLVALAAGAFLAARGSWGDSLVHVGVAHPRPRRPHQVATIRALAARTWAVSLPSAFRATCGPWAGPVRLALRRPSFLLPRPAIKTRRAAESPSAAPGGTPPEREALKAELLDLVIRSKRGSDASLNDEISSAFKLLEQHNPCVAPLDGDAVKGEWELLWTTSESILGLGRPFPFRPLADKPILQYLDPANGRARNLEYTLLGTNSVEAEIKPIDEDGMKDYVSKLDDFLMFKLGAQEPRGGTYLPRGSGLEKTAVAVRFKTFKVLNGLISIPAPESATGILQVTYLDDDLRLSRGDRGNLFVLRKAGDEQVPS